MKWTSYPPYPSMGLGVICFRVPWQPVAQETLQELKEKGIPINITKFWKKIWSGNPKNWINCYLLVPTMSLQQNCSRVRTFLNYRLGQYITNVTRAAEVCSQYLCQSNGRCLRRDPRAPHFLHLSRTSYRINSNRNGTFTITGWHSQHELQQLSERFRCHCYEGYEGERCDSTEPTHTADVEVEEREQDQRTKSSAESVESVLVLVVMLVLFTFSCI